MNRLPTQGQMTEMDPQEEVQKARQMVKENVVFFTLTVAAIRADYGPPRLEIGGLIIGGPGLSSVGYGTLQIPFPTVKPMAYQTWYVMLRRLLQQAVHLSLPRFQHDSATVTMDLTQVTSALKKFAPTSLAGSWDNVGLLIEPTLPHTVKKMLLTNDLTEAVLKEAIEQGVDMILSYHPPIFAPLKRLTQAKWKERIVISCIENRIALYSPHTSYDAVKGGVNDWLISCFKGEIKPLETVKGPIPTIGKFKMDVNVPHLQVEKCRAFLQSVSTDVVIMSEYSFIDEESKKQRFGLNANQTGLSAVIDFFNNLPDVKKSMEISELVQPVIPHHGAGRICKLNDPLSLSAAVKIVKSHLNLPHVRLAKAIGRDGDSPVQSVAVCAGSGASVLRGVRADLYVTGEMSHHEVLDAAQTGHSVILADHSNTERGFLPVLKERLAQDVFNGQVELIVSKMDADPLDVV